MTSVAVNGRYQGKSLTGIYRYAGAILRAFPQDYVEIVPEKPLNGIPGHIWEQFALPAKIKSKQRLWSPANSGPLAVRRQVLTIHDISVIEHPEWFKSEYSLWYRTFLPSLVRRVDKIITVSEFTKTRLQNYYNLPSEKIIVIPNGVDHDKFNPKIDINVNLRKYQPYLLTVGSIEPRKNLKRLLTAWNRSNLFKEGFNLLVIGAQGDVFKNPMLHDADKIKGVHFLGFVSDEDLPSYYAGATSFVYVSLYEGFGLPVLEAMACGVPVITSNTTALPAVVGDSASLVDPTEIEDLEMHLKLMIFDDAYRNELSEKAIDRAKLFSWQKAALATWEVLTND